MSNGTKGRRSDCRTAIEKCCFVILLLNLTGREAFIIICDYIHWLTSVGVFVICTHSSVCDELSKALFLEYVTGLDLFFCKVLIALQRLKKEEANRYHNK